MAQLIVVTGPPGAGKSTVAGVLVQEFDHSALVAGDDFFGFLRRGFIAPWLPEAHSQNDVVLGAAAAAAGRLVNGGYTVVYDGVVGPWSLDRFLVATGLPSLQYAVLLPSEPCCLSRVRTRVGHGFSDVAAARHMYGEFQGADLDMRHVITEEVADSNSTAALVSRRSRDGLLEVPVTKPGTCTRPAT